MYLKGNLVLVRRHRENQTGGQRRRARLAAQIYRGAAGEEGRGFAGDRHTTVEAACGGATLIRVGVAMRLGLSFLSGCKGKLRVTRVTSPGVDSISIWPPK